MSNQRQLVMGVVQFRTMNRGRLPSGIYGGNVSNSRVLRYGTDSSGVSELDVGSYSATNPRPLHQEGWTHLGYLWVQNIVKDGRIFFCPGYEGTISPYIPTFEAFKSDLSGNGRLYTTYAYRLGGSWPNATLPVYSGNFLDAADEEKFVWGKVDGSSNALRPQGAIMGKFKGIKAITTDNFALWEGQRAQWAHTRPYCLVVGYSDGHVDVVPLQSKDYEYLSKVILLSQSDEYLTMYFRAFDDGDYQKIRKALKIN